MSRLALGIDIGGTGIKLGWVDDAGNVLTRASVPTPAASSPTETVACIKAAVQQLGQDGAARPGTVGIGCAGLIDSQRGIVRTSPNLPAWHDVPLAQLLAEALAMPSVLLNDATAFALAEARIGAGRAASPVLGLTIGTGIGGGLVIDGRTVDGHRGFAGEIGHMSVDLAGPDCACGNRGCLELYVGRRALVRNYLQRVTWSAGNPVHELAGGDREQVEPLLVATAAQQGDGPAAAAFASCGRVLGVGLANLTNLVDPAVIVIGGGLSQAGELLIEPARREMSARAMAIDDDLPRVSRAALGVDGGLIGAALSALAGAPREAA